MKFLLYAIMAYDNSTDAYEKSRGHVHWFNPYNITIVKAYEEKKLVMIEFCNANSIWCDIGEWQSVIEKIHIDTSRPTDMRIQEVVVTK